VTDLSSMIKWLNYVFLGNTTSNYEHIRHPMVPVLFNMVVG